MYQATLTSSEQAETATLSFTITNSNAGNPTQTTNVIFYEENLDCDKPDVVFRKYKRIKEDGTKIIITIAVGVGATSEESFVTRNRLSVSESIISGFDFEGKSLWDLTFKYQQERSFSIHLIQALSDGKFIATGVINPENSKFRLVVLKFDAFGKVLFAKSIFNSQSDTDKILGAQAPVEFVDDHIILPINDQSTRQTSLMVLDKSGNMAGTLSSKTNSQTLIQFNSIVFTQSDKIIVASPATYNRDLSAPLAEIILCIFEFKKGESIPDSDIASGSFNLIGKLAVNIPITSSKEIVNIIQNASFSKENSIVLTVTFTDLKNNKNTRLHRFEVSIDDVISGTVNQINATEIIYLSEKGLTFEFTKEITSVFYGYKTIYENGERSLEYYKFDQNFRTVFARYFDKFTTIFKVKDKNLHYFTSVESNDNIGGDQIIYGLIKDELVQNECFPFTKTDKKINFSVKEVTLSASNQFAIDFSFEQNFATNKIDIVPGQKLKIADEIYCSYSPCDDPDAVVVNFDENTHLQSPHIFLQAAGSNGYDGSTEGIHLRWLFKNKLEQHLPKGNLADTELNFNKPDDFVRIYRTPFQHIQTTIDLENKPAVIDDQSGIWIYQREQDKFLVRFLDQNHYRTVRQTINPLTANPLDFLRQYGNRLIEIESRNALAYSVEVIPTDTVPQSQLQTELLAVEENKFSTPKHLVARQSYPFFILGEMVQMADNIRSVRFKAQNCIMHKVRFGLYKNNIKRANATKTWTEVGSYALTESDSEAFERLEPIANTVHGKWPRFNGTSYINIDNYKDRWNGPRDVQDKNLKQIIQRYIELSNDGMNPKAIENLEYTNAVDGETLVDTYQVSYLDLLFIASMDFHFARMMGLGTLDYDANEDEQQYIYAMEYITKGNLGDGVRDQEVQHLYLSLPTGQDDDRLPLPMDLKTPLPGISKEEGGINDRLTDHDGYTFDGKKRFISLFTEEITDYNAQSFYQTSDQFNSSETTTPVYAGIEYKNEGDTDWIQPELSHTNQLL